MHVKPELDIRIRFNGETTGRGLHRKRRGPQPTQAEIDAAVKEYLENGGKIKRVVIDSDTPMNGANFGHDLEYFFLGE